MSETKKVELVIFPGKNTPLKRYKPYFPMFDLRLVNEGEKPETILAHSKGFVDAIEYCLKHNSTSFIVSMDGSKLPQELFEKMSDEFKKRIFYFYPMITETTTDEMTSRFTKEGFRNFCYLADNPYLGHYPYMFKKIRDLIVHALLIHD